MTRLAFPAYLDHLVADSTRFRTVLAIGDPAARVPGCPDWDATDLLWHLAEVQLFWATIITNRPAGPPENWPPPRPETFAGVLEAFDTGSAALVSALGAADPADHAWHWAEEQSVAISYRRQAHEALIHRLDAEQTTDTVTPLDPDLAADGVAECLEIMYGGEPPEWGRFEPGAGVVKLTLTDVGIDLWARPGLFFGTEPESGKNYDSAHVLLVDDPSREADATITGNAGDVDAWLWKRRDDAGIEMAGDATTLAAFSAAVNPPLT